MKPYKHALLTGVCMLWLCYSAFSQLCPSNALAPVFSQDFGQGATSTSTTAAAAGSTGYNFGGVGSDGNYVLTPLFDNAGKADWTKGGDHTGNPNGNMFLVNAGGGKSLFFKQTVTGLCSGSIFNFSAWLANANTPTTISSSCGASYVYANVIFNIKDLSGTILATYNTGNLPVSPVNGPPNWKQYGFQFSLPNGTTSLVLEMVDYYGGANACGNDLALDDILFTACTPQVSVTLNTSTSICAGSSTTMTSSLVNSPFTTPAYQWQKSTDNGTTWTNIGTASTSASYFDLNSVTAGDGAQYRILVGPNIASLASSSCVTASNPITLTVFSKPTVTITTNTLACTGGTLNLSSTVSGGLAPYQYSWTGPSSFASTQAATSVLNIASGTSGTYQFSTTDANGCNVFTQTTVTVQSSPSLSIANNAPVICSGASVSVVATSSISGSTYYWTPTVIAGAASGYATNSAGSLSGTINDVITNSSGSSATVSYQVTAVAPSGCSASGFTNVLVYSSIGNQIDNTPQTFCAGQTASITGQTPTGGNGTYQYTWSQSYDGGTTWSTITGATGISLSFSTTATVMIRRNVTSATCSSASSITTITVQTALANNTLTGTQQVCTGSAATAITGLTPTGGNGIYQYAWEQSTDNGTTWSSVAGATSKDLLPGTVPVSTLFRRTVTSGFCSGPQSIVSAAVTVTVNSVPVINAIAVTTCSGIALGVTPADITNGTIPAGTTYTWGVPTGTGFTGAASQTVAAGNVNGLLTNTTNTAVTAVYHVTPSSGACTGAVFTVTATINPAAVLSAITNTVCSGTTFNITPVNAVNGIIPAGTVYNWGTPSVTAGLANGQAGTNMSSINGTLINTTNTTQTATYSVTPVATICGSGITFTVTVTVYPVAAVNAVTVSTCSGTSFSLSPVNGTNGIVPAGTTYTWTTPFVTGGISGGTTGTNAGNINGTLTNPANTAQTATYTVIPATVNCGAASSFTITVTVNPTATITPITAIVCSGATFTVTPTNGANGVIPAGTLYAWSAPSGTGFTGGASQVSAVTMITGTLSNTLSSQVTATYFVTTASGTCAGSAFSVTVSLNPTATVNAMSAITCSGAAFTLTPANISNGIIPAGTLYSWSAPSVTGGITGGQAGTTSTNVNGTLVNPANSQQTATYTVTPVTPSCGTAASFTVTVTLNAKAVVTQISATACSGVLFNVTPVNGTNGIVPSGTTYTWGAPTGSGFTGGATQIAASANVFGTLTNTTSSAKTVTYLVTPLSGSCTGAIFSVTVNLNPTATVTAMSAVTCSGVTFTVTPTDGTNGVIPVGTLYNWSAPGVTGGITGGLSATGATNVAGTLVNPTNAQQTATYTVTPITPNCGAAVSFTVTVTLNPTATIVPLSVIACSGVTFNVTPVNGASGIVPAGTTYTWGAPTGAGFTGGATQVAGVATILGTLTNTTSSAKTVTYLVTPLSGSCTGAVFSVTVNLNPTATVTAMSTVTCNGVTFTVTPTDGTNGIIPAGTTYAWSAPGVTGGITGGLSASGSVNVSGTLTNPTNTTQTATYTVTPTTVNCGAALSFTVTVTVNPSATVNTLTTTTCTGVAFSVTPANVTNGVIPTGTLYTWSAPTGAGFTGGASQVSAVGTITGTLFNTLSSQVTATYTVTPVSGACTGAAFSLLVTVNPGANITPMSAVTCSGVAFTVTPTDGVNGIVPVGTTYTWSAPTGTGFTGGVTQVSAATNVTGTLTNITNAAVTATYIVTPSTTCGTSPAFSVTVTLNSKAVVTPISVITCSGVTFNVTPVNGTDGIVPAGTTYTWAAPIVTGGITGGVSTTNSVSINGTLTNPLNTQQTATYIVTPLSGSCTGIAFAVTVTINPVAVITAITTVSCSGAPFTVTPTNITNGIIPAGTLYSWSAPAVTGGITGGASGSGAVNITGSLVNPANVQQTATYTVTPITVNCGTATAFTLTVTLSAKATITPISTTTCNGVTFVVTPTDAVDGVIPAGTMYTWALPTGTGFTGGLSQPVASVNVTGTLVNTTNSMKTATYIVTPLSGVCTGTVFTVTVNINPIATITTMTTVTCSGVTFMVTPTQGTNGIVPAGTSYSWSAPAFTAGITGGVSGTGINISGTLVNTLNSQQTATYTVTPLSGVCTGVSFTVTVNVNPTAAISTMSTVTCSGVIFIVSPANITNGIVPAGTLYSWSAPSVTGGQAGGLSATNATSISGIITNPLNTQQTATYTVTPLSGICTGASFTVTVNVNPTAVITAMSTVTCSGATFTVTPTNIANGIIPAGTLYSWSAPSVTGGITGGVSATNAISISATLTNPLNTQQTATYIVTPLSGACTGASFTVTVNVNPTAVITAMSTITCSGVAFTVTPTNIANGIVPAGTLYGWSAPSVTGGQAGGLSATNATSISGIVTNPLNTQQTATYIITPLSGACTAASFTVTVNVNPTAVITAMSTVACSGVTFNVSPTNITNGIVPAGTLYSWSAPSVTGGITGGQAGTNVVNINGTLVNPTSVMQTATYIVTPLSGACTGASFTVTVNVNPTAVITAMSTVTCSGVTFTVTPTNGVNGVVPAGTLYNWSAPSVTGGLAGGATGTNVVNVNGILVNSTSITQTATYIVTPLSGACTGVNFTVTVTVNPKAAIASMTAITCSGVTFTVTSTDGVNGVVPAGTLYSWSAPSVTGGLAGGATGTNVVNVNGTLTNPLNTTQTATYTITPLSGACTGVIFSVTVTVNPTAVITAMSTVTCSGVAFTTTPTNGINGIVPAGTLYSWSAPSVTGGITGGVSGSGSVNVTGSLVNPTSSTQTATYIVTPTTVNCGNNTPFTVTVTLTPTAAILPLSATTCSGVAFMVTPTDIANGIVPAGTTYTWNAPTGTGFTGGATQVAASANVFGTLTNTTSSVQTATYLVTPFSGSCTGPVFSVTITISPKAIINALTTTTCSGVTFNVTPVDATNGIVPAGTMYKWAAPTGTGFTGGVSQSTQVSTIPGTLANTTNIARTATYIVTPLSGSCAGVNFTVTVTVSSVGIINTLTTTVCTGVTFNVTPTNGASGVVPAGTLYSWSAPTGTGFTGGASQVSPVSTIIGTLYNVISAQVTATYTVTPVSGACTGAAFSLLVTVNPGANITPMSAVTCSGVAFTVTPTDGVNGIVPVGTTFTWSAPTGTGFTGGATQVSATTNVTGTLTNITNAAVTATYIITPSTTCGTSPSFSVTVILNPTAVITPMSTTTCSGVTFTVTPTNITDGIVPVGTTYTWSAPTGTGFTGGATQVAGVGNISGTLTNTTSAAVTATYIVTPSTVLCGSAAPFSVTVTINPKATVNALTTITCSGVTFTVTPTDGTNGIVPAGTLYSWSAPGVTGGITGGVSATNAPVISGTLTSPLNTQQTATYTVTPLSGVCTGVNFTVTVTVNPTAVITAMSTVTCSGVAFTVTPTNIANGIVPTGTLYSWSAPGVTGGLTGGLSATNTAVISGTLTNPLNTQQTATYIITPLSGACTGASFTVTVNVNPTAVITAMSTITCSGVLFTVSPTNIANGIVPTGTLYSWSAPGVTGGLTGGVSATNVTFISGTLTNPLNTQQTATYTVTPLSGACTGASFTVTVNVNPTAVITAMSTVTCSGVAFTVTPTNIANGIVPVGTLYSWSAPGVTGGLTGGVSATNTAFISGTLTNPLNTQQTATYIVTPLSGACTGAAFTVTVNVNPTAVITAMSTVTCSGVLFTVSPTNIANGIVPTGTLYSWSVPGVTGGLTGGVSATNAISINGTLTNPLNTQQTATYTVTPLSGACTGASFTVTVNVNPTAVITAMSTVTCSGVAFTVTPTNIANGIVPAGTLYSWSAPGVTGGITGGVSVTNAINISGTLTNPLNTQQTATYTVTPLSGACTGASFTVTVNVNPTAVITAMSTVTCSGVLFTVSPTNIANGIVPAGTLYSWSAPSVTGGITGGVSATNAISINGTLTNPLNTQQTATYTVTPLSGVCTGASFTVTVNVNPTAVITAMSTITCSGVLFTVSPTNIANGIVPTGTLYSWSAPSVMGGITGGVSATNAISINGTLSNPLNTQQTATYTVTPLSGACTGASFTVTVNVNPTAVITAMSTVTCSGVAFTVTPTNIANGIVPAGTLYSWSAPSVTGGITGGVSITGSVNVNGTLVNPTSSVQTATYIVTPTTVNCGNNTPFTVTVTLNPIATVTPISTTTCSGITFTVTPTDIVNGVVPAGTTYTWSAPGVTGGLMGGISATNATLISGTLHNPLNTQQTASYTVTPLSGACTGASFTVTVNVTPTAVISTMSTVTCSGVLFTVSPTNITNGIVPTGTLYNWSAPSVTGGLTGGLSATNATSISGTLTNPLNTQQTASYIITPLSGACTGVSFTVVININPTAVITAMSTITCSGATFTVTPTNIANGIVPAGTLYNWSAPSVTGGITGGASATNAVFISGTVTNALNTQQTATYTVTPLSGACTGVSFTVTVNINPTATVNNLTTAICSGTVFGFTPVNGIDGVVPVSSKYSWSAPSVTGSITGGQAGNNLPAISGSLINTGNTPQTATYLITPVSGACTGNLFTVTVTVNPAPKAAITVASNISCAPFSVTNSVIAPVLYPGSNGSYNWYINNVFAGSGSSFPGFVLTTDSATVKLKTISLFGCGSDSTQTVVSVYSSPRPSFTLSDSSGCGPLSVTVGNTTPQVSSWLYKWDMGNGQQTNQAQPGTIIFNGSSSGNDTTYTITLKAYQYCDTVSVTKQVLVSRKANLAITANIVNTCSPMKVIFQNQSNGIGVQYRLIYGDGTDSVVNPVASYTHIYHTGNQTTFNALLQATNACGTDSSFVPVAALPNSVNQNLTVTDSVVCGNPYTITVFNNTDSVTRYTWDFGDGTPVQTTFVRGNINHTYQQAGNYLITNSINGTCSDSILYRGLKVYPSVHSVAAVVTQNNCIGTPVYFKNLSDSSLSYQWSFNDGSLPDSSGSHNFAQPGNYMATLKVWRTHNDITCIDTTQQSFTIVSQKTGHFTLSDTAGKCLPFTVSFANQKTNNAQTTWSWGDGSNGSGDTTHHNYTTNGNYTITMQAMQTGGCNYIDSATVRINAPEASVQYKGGVYCKQNSTIDFNTVASSTDSMRWDFGDGSLLSTTSQKVSHTYTNAGSFIPKLSLIGGSHCIIPVATQDTIQIDEIKPGFKLFATNDCAQTNYRFTDTSQSYFNITKRVWKVDMASQTALATSENKKEVSQVYTTPGNYGTALQVQNSIGCTAALDAKFNVVVYDYPQANINAISDACLNNLMEIKSVINSQDSIMGRYWNLGNGLNATDSVVQVLYSTEGQYQVKLTVATVNSCYDSAYKQLVIHGTPTLSLVPDNIVCKGTEFELKATGAISYIWKDQNDNILCTNCASAKIQPVKNMKYKVIGYNEYGCSSVQTTTVRVAQPFKLDVKDADSVCVGGRKQIIVNGGATYTWAPTPGLSSYTGGTTYASPVVNTTYQVIGKDAYQCFADTASIKIVVGRPTPINIGKDTTVPAGVPIQLNTGNLSQDIKQWKWGGKGDFSCVYCASPQVKVINDEYLTCDATNQFGCITTDTLYVKTFCSGSQVFIPNAFSPDGDGVNDVLIVQGQGIKIIKSFRIFSRWGEMVFEKTNFLPGDKASGWDGKIRGKQASSDVFVYLCEAVCEKGTTYTFKGNVAIIK